MASTDLFQQRAKECRRLAATARNTSDRAFWLELVERWEVVSARQYCLRQGALMGRLQKQGPSRGGKAAGASPGLQNGGDHSQRRRLR